MFRGQYPKPNDLNQAIAYSDNFPAGNPRPDEAAVMMLANNSSLVPGYPPAQVDQYLVPQALQQRVIYPSDFDQQVYGCDGNVRFSLPLENYPPVNAYICGDGKGTRGTPTQQCIPAMAFEKRFATHSGSYFLGTVPPN